MCGLLQRPIGLILASIFWFFSIHVLQFEGQAYVLLIIIVQVIFSVGLIWGAYRLVDVVAYHMKKITEKTDTPFDDEILPLLTRSLRIFTVVFGALIVFQNLGVNVMSVLAGLGLGGLAFALAAKDACANLLGSLMILLDRPFSVGDWINVDGADGTVEAIGFRSTRIRTFYNSQITIPNAAVANANIDNYGKREWRRIVAKLGLTYDTPPGAYAGVYRGS